MNERSQKRLCKECKIDSIVTNMRENYIVCTNCGTIQGNANESTMSQTFEESKQTSATNHYEALGGFVDKKFKIAQYQTNQITNSKAQNRMRNLTKKLENISGQMQLCKRIVDRASVIMFSSLKNKSLKRIKKDELLAAVCVILAAREARIQFTFREVSEACEKVTKKEICRVYKQHERVLNKQNGKKLMDLDQIRFDQMINRFTSILCIEWLNQKKIRKLYNKINKEPDLATLNPLTRLACSIYLIMGEEKNNCHDVAKTCNVSQHTILRSTELVKGLINI